MGKDAIVAIGESEPMDLQTHQIIDLKPNGKGKDERYTTSVLIFSMDYYDALLNYVPVVLTPEGGTGFEASEGWTGFPLQSSATPFDNVTDSNGNLWSGDGYIWHQDDPNLPKSGTQVMALGLNTSEYASVEVDTGNDGVEDVTFYIKAFSSNISVISATVDYNAGSGWVNVWSESYAGDTIPSKYLPVTVPVDQPGDVNIRFGVTGLKGLIFDEVSFTPYKP